MFNKNDRFFQESRNAQMSAVDSTSERLENWSRGQLALWVLFGLPNSQLESMNVSVFHLWTKDPALHNSFCLCNYMTWPAWLLQNRSVEAQDWMEVNRLDCELLEWKWFSERQPRFLLFPLNLIDFWINHLALFFPLESACLSFWESYRFCNNSWTNTESKPPSFLFLLPR